MPFAIPFSDRVELLFPITLSEIPPLESTTVSAQVRQAIHEALERGETHYTDRPGILPLREPVAESLKRRFGVEVNAEDSIIVTCGIVEARFIATQQVLQPGDALAVPIAGERVSGAAVLGRIEITTSAEPETQALYLCSSIPEPSLRSHIAGASSSAFIIYEIDEEQSRSHPAQIAGCEDRTLTLGTLGIQSWQVGYLAAPGKLSSRLRDFKQALTICTTSLSQWAALAAMEGV